MREQALIGELARAAAVDVQTVRYYERLGLLPKAQRNGSGYRVYGSDSLDRLLFIRQAQAAGFRLEEIKEILRLRYAGKSPCECVRTMLAEKLDQVEREMTELARFRRRLRRMLGRAKRLPRAPHSASLICPIIQGTSKTDRSRNSGRKRSGKAR